MSRALKTIVYRGGILTFRVPSNWRETYDPDGGGEFFEDGPDKPTLRLNVLTARGPDMSASAAADFLAKKHGAIERREDGTALVRYVQPAEERGTRLLLTRWEIAQALPPHHLRILAFTWTILASQEHDASIREDFELLDAEIRSAVLSPRLGEVRSGCLGFLVPRERV